MGPSGARYFLSIPGNLPEIERNADVGDSRETDDRLDPEGRRDCRGDRRAFGEA
jgi:hypothetical protein